MTKANRLYCNLQTKAFILKYKLREKLMENKGSFLTDHALAIVIVIVVASIFLLGLRTTFEDTIISGLDDSAKDFFGQAVS